MHRLQHSHPSSNKPDSNKIPNPATGRPPASKDADPPSLKTGDPKVESKPAVASPISSNGPPAPSRLADVGSQGGNSGGVSIADPAVEPQLSSGEGHTQLPTPPIGQPPGSTLIATQALSAQAIVVQGHVIAENSPPVTIDGNAVGFSSGSIYVGSNVAPAPTHGPQQSSATVFQGLIFSPLPPNAATNTALPIATGDDKIITALRSSGELAIEGITIKPGDAPITVAGTAISVGAGVVAIGSATITIPTPLRNPIFTNADHPFTANPTGFSIFDTTLLPGSPGVTIAETQLSLAPSGALVIGSSTVQLSVLAPTPPPITFASQTITADSASQYIIDSQTLSASGPAITIKGTPILLAPSGTLLIGSSTVFLNPPPSQTLPRIPLASQTITANSLSRYIIDSQTLVPGGPAITVNGTPISLPATPSDVVIGSSTESLATTAGPELGGVILSGLGPIGPGEPTAATAATAANANYTGPMFESSTGCVSYWWSWPWLGLSLFLGLSSVLWP